jgi:hypothetical protein
MIPKIIFQTHDADYSDLPEFMRELSNTWINLNPGYQYVYMNATERRNYIADNYPILLELFDIVPVQYKSDLWRYCIVYDNGGVYADTDSVCVQSIDNALKLMTNEHEMLCTTIGRAWRYVLQTEETDCFHVNNANFVSVKNSKIMGEVLQKIINFCTKQNGNLNPDIPNLLASWAWSFSETVLDNKDKCLFIMDDFSLHGDVFKNDSSIVRNTFNVKYFDQTVEYKDLFKLS